MCCRYVYSLHEGKFFNDNRMKSFQLPLGLIFFRVWDSGITGKKSLVKIYTVEVTGNANSTRILKRFSVFCAISICLNCHVV